MSKKLKSLKSSKFYQKHIFLLTYLFGLGVSFLFIPFLAFAATTYSQDLFGLFEYLKDIIDDIVLWLFTTGAVIVFLGYLVYITFIQRPNSSSTTIGGELRQRSKYIMYGLIALTLMFTFYAVSGLIAVTFGIQIGIPQFFKNQDGLSPGSGNINRTYSVIR